MKLAPLFLFLFLLALPALVSAQQQIDWNISGAGARAEGLGGAFIGVADDATAIVWNPGGLGQIERPEASIVLRLSGNKLEYTDNVSAGYNATTTQSHGSFNFGSFAYPIHLGTSNLVIAAAFQKQLDLYSNEETGSYKYESQGGANTVTPGIALRMGPVFGIGAAANIWLGQNTQKSTDKTSSTETTTTLDFSGTNFALGALVDLSGLKQPIPLKLGVSFKTPFDLKAKVSGTGYAGTNYEYIIQMPSMIGFGASFRIGDNFTVAGDYETRAYGSKKLQVTSDGAVIGEASVSDAQKDLNQFRVGAEYLIVLRGGVIPLRAGFHTVPTTLANRQWDGAHYQIADQVVGSGIALGTGFIANSFAIDAAISVDSYKQDWTDPSIPQTDFENKFTDSRISISLIFYF